MKIKILLFIATIGAGSFAKSRDGAEAVSYFKETTNGNGADVNRQNGAVPKSVDKDLNMEYDGRYARLSYLDTVVEDLLHRPWKEYEKPCLGQIVRIIRHVQNSTLWATWIWDSMQFPVGQLYGSRKHLGNYDQCLDLPWSEHPELRTQYCLVEVTLSEIDPGVTNVDLHGSVQKYIRRKSRHGLRYNDLLWGVCMPAVCKPESIAKFSLALFKASHLGWAQATATVNPAHCRLAGEQQDGTLKDRYAMCVIIILTLVTLVCTFYVNTRKLETKITTVLDLAKAFDIKSNAQRLMKIENQLRSVLGIRVISTFLIIQGHQWLAKNIFGISNAEKLDKSLDSVSSTYLFNVDMTVDVFFMFSGLFLIKNLMRNQVTANTPLTTIATRYFRSIFLIIVTIMIQPLVYFSGEVGPLNKHILQGEVETCNQNRWKTFLMISNYSDNENMCHTVFWSMPCDFHFSIIGVVIYWIYTRNRRAGIMAFLTGATLAVAIPVIHGYMHNSPAVVSFDFRCSDDFRKYLIGNPAYTRSHLRAGPHFVGMSVGYMMALYNPAHYRNIISKKKSISAFLTFFVLFVSLNYAAGAYHLRQYSALEGALFAVFRRNAFAALIAFLIIICEYGTLPLVTDFLSWSVLVPLSKLSYGVYMLHMFIIFRMVSEARAPLRHDNYDDIITTFGLFAVSAIFSLFLFLFLEAPVTNFIRIMFKRSPTAENREENRHSEMKEWNTECTEYTNHRETKKLN